jgi:MscS family membrane protein
MNMKFLNNLENEMFFESWILKIICIIAAAILVNLIGYYLFHYAKKVTKATANNWDDSLVKAANFPALILSWIIVVKLVFDIFAKEFYGAVFALSFLITKMAIILCFAWFLLRFIAYATQGFIESGKALDKEFDRTTVDALSKLFKLIVVIFTILVIVQNLGFSISGILAAGGAGGLVLGFAAKDLFANLFGGLTIYLDRPFSVGDWIRCSEKQIEGTVEHIGWRQTRLRSLNMNAIYVPNSIFTTIVVENPSRMTNRRINEVIGIRYSDIDKMPIITSEIKELLDRSQDLDQDRIRIASFDKFNNSSVDFTVYAFTKTIDWQEYRKVKQEIFLQIAKIIEKNGAEFAFPTSTIHLEGAAKTSLEKEISR